MGTTGGLVEKYPMGDLLKLTWWLRGIGGALAVLGIITEFTEIERPTFLRAIHGVLFGWNQLMALVGDYIGLLPYIPELDAQIVNLLVIFWLLYVPMIMSYNAGIDFRRSYKFFDFKLWLVWTGGTFLFALQCLSVWYNISNPLGHNRNFPPFWIGVFLYTSYVSLKIINDEYPTYVRGVMSCVIGLLTWEVLYLANLPFVSPGIKAISCEILEIPKETC